MFSLKRNPVASDMLSGDFPAHQLRRILFSFDPLHGFHHGILQRFLTIRIKHLKFQYNRIVRLWTPWLQNGLIL